jgi:flagellar basal-body rod modification protein FlgD
VSATSGTSQSEQTRQAAADAATTRAAGSLGQDAFLKLLIAQLQNQDPTKPMDDTTFITQLATFSSLEKLTSIDSAIKQLTELVAGTAATSIPGGTK